MSPFTVAPPNGGPYGFTRADELFGRWIHYMVASGQQPFSIRPDGGVQINPGSLPKPGFPPWHPRIKASAAASKVFQTPELVERILDQARDKMAIKQFFALRRVNSLFYDTLSRSPKFRKTMMLSWPTPAKGSFEDVYVFYRNLWDSLRAPLYPFVCYVVPDFIFGSLEFRFGVDSKGLAGHLRAKLRVRVMQVLYGPPSWHNMLLTTSPFPIKLSFHGINFSTNFVSRTQLCFRPNHVIRLGDLMEDLEKYLQFTLSDEARAYPRLGCWADPGNLGLGVRVMNMVDEF